MQAKKRPSSSCGKSAFYKTKSENKVLGGSRFGGLDKKNTTSTTSFNSVTSGKNLV